MRKWTTLLLLLTGLVGHARAAKSVNVEELDQLLAANHGKSDSHIAQQLSDLAVTERISVARLARWEAEYPGAHTREELIKLADLSAFLNLPGEDTLRDPAPDSETQSQMFSLAIEYVKSTFTRLPNFYAQRATTHFQDEPSRQLLVTSAGSASGWRSRPLEMATSTIDAKPLHITGTYTSMVLYRDGYEVHNEKGQKSKTEDQIPGGLTTNGEFGPILGVVVSDAVRGRVQWGYWEQGTSEPVAVFRYEVPADQSHYLVGVPVGATMQHLYPGYHGELAIDPETGTILRLSLVAEMKPPHEMIEAAIVVEYGPQSIGEHSYICPVHGVARSRFPVAGTENEGPIEAVQMQTELNDVRFTQYHLFRSEAHIVTDEPGQKGANGDVPGATPDAEPRKPEGQQDGGK